MTVSEILEHLGGERHVAYRLDIHQYTVKHWPKKGIPSKYWKKLIALSKGKLTAETLLKASTK